MCKRPANFSVSVQLLNILLFFFLEAYYQTHEGEITYHFFVFLEKKR